MYIFHNTNTDPYWNLAAEEYLLKNFEEDFFVLWRNQPAIIIGRHQNANAEINIEHVKQNSIKVVRRITGGGAVFHDLGNINFTFIQGGEDPKSIDFDRYTKPIVNVLQKLGVNASMEGRNDISINGSKISGNAEHIDKKRLLHHGTLLFSSDMVDLSSALKVHPAKYQDKAIQSVRKRVANISDHLQQKMSVEQFIENLLDEINQQFLNSQSFDFDHKDKEHIEALVEKKYRTWEWTFGKSPNYNFEQSAKTPGGVVEFKMQVSQGIIEDLKIYGDFFSALDVEDVEKLLKGIPHDEKAIRQKLETINVTDYFNNVTKEDLLPIMF